MGLLLNPGNSGFTEIVDDDYVDKTGMISIINGRIGKKNKLICISRPRRFGKSWDAKMLAAYYDCSCDSHKLFDSLTIAQDPTYAVHLNQYHVVLLDVISFISSARWAGEPLTKVPQRIVQTLHQDLHEMDPGLHESDSVKKEMLEFVEKTGGRKFIFIIDEWDAMIREADEEAQDRYLNLLRDWFKDDSFTSRAIASAYMTGILPIKKENTQSVISDFKEYSILSPGPFSSFTGFLEKDVQALCRTHRMPFRDIKNWYDGYILPAAGPIYSPYSVMNALESKKCRSYWGKTSASESLTSYISMDFQGLQKTIVQLIGGESIPVSVDKFENNVHIFHSKDDVLTLLVHLGYLTYDEETHTVRIPNLEVRHEFDNFIAGGSFNTSWMVLMNRSRKLLRDTLAGDTASVASIIEEIREEQYAPQYYNNEQALRFLLKFAYIAALEEYVKMEELPSGKGLADIVFLPKRFSPLPALILELKWNQSAAIAVQQIERNAYYQVLKDYGGEILFVGIAYDVNTKLHTCEIKTFAPFNEP